MKILIVEDEYLARERLTDLVQKYNPTLEITAQFDSVSDTIEFFENGGDADLIFMDIQLSDGTSFEIFEKIELHKPVIFTTAYEQYALNAFKVNSIDYILKPIDYTELKLAIEKYEKIFAEPVLQEVTYPNFNGLLRNLRKDYKKRFIVKFGDRIQFKPIEEIAYLYADGKTVYIVANNGRKYVIDHTLEELEHYLLDPQCFFRVNRKFIVKIDAISDIRTFVNSRLKVVLNVPCEMDIIVSREKVNSFKEWLDQ
jgi:DNA-binding LytR/AlgR family response regulator